MSRLELLALLVLSTTLVSCGVNPFGSPPRVRTDGFQATAFVDDGSVQSTFGLAVRGKSLRRDELGGGPWSVLVVRGEDQTAFELDPATKSWREADSLLAATILTGHPLSPGFSEVEESKQRGAATYSKEGDAVFAGNRCVRWLFDNDPSAPATATTTYWVCPVLDDLVVRCDHVTKDPEGGTLRRTTELRAVRVGAPPELFEIPKGFRKVEAPDEPGR